MIKVDFSHHDDESFGSREMWLPGAPAYGDDVIIDEKQYSVSRVLWDLAEMTVFVVLK